MTISLVALMCVIMVCLAVGAAAGFYVGRGRARDAEARANDAAAKLAGAEVRAAAAEARSDQLLAENEGLIKRARDDADVLRALTPITKQLDQVDAHMRRLESATAARHSEVVTQLKREAEVTKELSDTTTSLNAALRSTSARGRWGEVQLRRLIEAAGMVEHVDFDTQVGSARFTNGAETALRPDVIIHLPGDGHIAVDAKVPMDSYLEAMELPAGDSAHAKQRADLLTRHARAMRGHVDALIKRNYPADFPDSPQVTVMFLPAESLLAEAVQADPTLLDHALTNGILLAAPSSLLALLRSIASVWSSSATSAEAREVVRLGRELVDRLSVFVGHMDRLGRSLGASVNHYNKAVSSLETRLLTKARQLGSLSAEGLESPTDISGDSGQIREFRAPEVAGVESPAEPSGN
ncbi:DNA recombination protein RmuC [Trueperella bialowiezensis]|uniref:DNA recombination protein rmuC n=1 Tax=Trueperella bialowiezensis TaxID=312285 RepID=A0A3S4V6B6_9ACTO|nr:DNA recombination protein RmuC [Trueperella bialowiezensis]VEI12986.1 DNA recombination protein rmuC [Trueperella bialowiezensis]